MPPPKDKKELQTLLGVITYLAKFTPQLSETTKPMRDLLKENTKFIWDTPQQTALQKVKDAISSQPILCFFDPHQKKITLQVDASKSGLGAAIFQESKPVAFASISVTSTEQNYPQIEREQNCTQCYLAATDFTNTCIARRLQYILTTNHWRASPRKL